MLNTGAPLYLWYPETDVDRPDIANHIKMQTTQLNNRLCRPVAFSLTYGFISYGNGYAPVNVDYMLGWVFITGIGYCEQAFAARAVVGRILDKWAINPTGQATLMWSSTPTTVQRFDVMGEGSMAFENALSAGRDVEFNCCYWVGDIPADLP